MKVFKGKCGIRVTVLADSINRAGNRFLTFEIEYPRLVLAEFNTHRVLSRNSFSSRAVPFDKMIENLIGRPVRFGANQAGMQDKGEDHNEIVLGWPQEYDGNSGAPAWSAKEAWNEAKEHAIYFAQAFKDAGYHKQVYNRLLEPFQMMKTVVSGTELSNFFWLRDDEMTDPTLAELAHVMRLAASESTPELLQPGDWHLPYVDYVMENGVQQWFIWPDEATLALKPADEMIGMGDMVLLSLSDAIKVSCARCAAVSYRNEGYGLEKSVELYERLVGADKKHASALEHCATPMKEPKYALDWSNLRGATKNLLNSTNIASAPHTWELGITHADRNYDLWSGNLKGWVQHRKLIPGENYDGEI